MANERIGVIAKQPNEEVTVGNLSAGFQLGKFKTITNKTANYTVTVEEAGSIFENVGDANAINWTLPAPSAATNGLVYLFVSGADQNMTVTSGTADKMITLNDLAADSISAQTANELIGAVVLVIGMQSKWLAIGLTEGATYTVAT